MDTFSIWPNATPERNPPAQANGHVQAGIDPHAGEQPHHLLAVGKGPVARHRGPTRGAEIELLHVKPRRSAKQQVPRNRPEGFHVGKS